jgi:predicted enzyme related to lactoylglutathione lyase
MSERSAYENGRPSWVDATSTDIAVTRAFYEGLFGWDLTDLGPETGGYTICRLKDRRVAALIPRTEGDPAPPHWNTYIACDDLEATVEKVRAAGGTVAIEPMDVFEEGRLAYAVDPTGAYVGLWQARQFAGAQLVNEAGAWAWAELRTRDVAAAAAFYQSVFEYDVHVEQMGALAYTELRQKGTEDVIAGVLDMADGHFPDEVPPHWGAYFGIADLDAGSARVKELGGEQLIDPIELPFGRFAAYKDTNGAAFSLFQATGS